MKGFSMMSIVVVAVPLICTLAGPLEAAQFTSPMAGYTLTYPDSWNAQPRDRDVAVGNFPQSAVPEGGFVPPGGADIIVNSFPPFDHPYVRQGLDDYDVLDKMAGRDTIISRTTRSSGQPARVTYVFKPANLRITDTIIHRSGKLFYIMLWCNADDPQVSAYDQTFNDLVASISIVGPTPSISVVSSPPAASTPTP